MKKITLLSAGQVPTYRFLPFFVLIALLLQSLTPAAAQTGPTVVHLPRWHYPGEIYMDSLALLTGPIPMDSSYVVQSGPELMGFSYEDQVFLMCDSSLVFRLQRTHTYVDWNTYNNPNVPAIVLPLLDLDNDGKVGDAYEVAWGSDSLRLVQNGVPTRALAPRTNGSYSYVQNTWVNVDLVVYGKVFVDSQTNCSFDAGEAPLSGWTVKVIGQVTGKTYTGQTDAGGRYFIAVCTEDNVVEVGLDVPFNYGQGCPTTYTVSLTSGVAAVQNIPVKLERSCPLMSIDLGTIRIRPCFPGAYSVSYCNLSAQTIPGAYVYVTLDDALTFTGSTIPGGHITGNTYGFSVGDLAPGYCGTFKLYFTPSCDLPPGGGTIHCSEAHIYPDSLCVKNSGWSGASLQASAICDGDSVRLALTNVGSAPMAAPLDFVIVEDLVMYMQAPFQLQAGATTTVATMANSATWRIEAPQEAEHPYGGIVSAFVEGCGGLSQPGLGLAFSLDNPNPFEAVDCALSIGSYDPNDKQAVPTGEGTEHYIKPNIELEYKIRFQNTGTDTAYMVVVLDTLSANLDATSIVPGASSHHYNFNLLPGNVLRFQFNNINLPDSTTNLDGSQGFFKYRIRQQPDLADNTTILNRAGIYFDNNTPVMTNYTYHEIKRNLLGVSAVKTPEEVGQLHVFPNPASGDVRIEWPRTAGEAWLVVTDALGRTVRTSHTAANPYRMERAGLNAGLYYFTIRTEAGKLYLGKVTLK